MEITYNEFIQNIIDTRGQWNIPESEYFEKHHIVPVCLGGEGDFYDERIGKWCFNKNSTHQNCIYLYKSEHIEAHRLLMLENPDNQKLACAYFYMSNNYDDEKLSSYYKLAQSRPGEQNGMYGTHRSGVDSPTYGKHWKVSKDKLYKFNHKGENNSMWGKHHSEESKHKMSLAAKNRPPVSDETRLKISASRIGKKHTTETKEKMSINNSMHNPENRLKVSMALKGKPSKSKGTVWINKNGETKMVKKELLLDYLNDGWNRGRS